MDDAYAAVVVRMGLEQELAQQLLGLGDAGAVQVQFVLHRVLAALEPLEHARRQGVAAVAGHVTGFERRAGMQQPGELAQRQGLVLLGHARARPGPGAGDGGHFHLAQRLYLADGRAEQGAVVFVF